MKVKCIAENAMDDGFKLGKTYDVIRKDDFWGYIVRDESGTESFLEEDECEVIEETPSEWSGESLPPVGEVCEVSVNNQEYREVEIVAYFDKTRSVVIYESPWTPEIYEWDDCKFRPIQSEKDKEIEKLTIHIDDFGNGPVSSETLAEYLYNQGYRKTK